MLYKTTVTYKNSEKTTKVYEDVHFTYVPSSPTSTESFYIRNDQNQTVPVTLDTFLKTNIGKHYEFLESIKVAEA